MLFENLNLNPALLKALTEEGYQTPTPIQAKAIPIVLARRDLLGCAQTGTGKTAAFALPILQLLHEHPVTDRPGTRPIRTLVLTPTRELAVQIEESFASYGRHLPIRHTVVFGGVSQFSQEKAIRYGVDILVATPGRLLDLVNQGIIDLSQVEFFVLDEADRMLDMGFLPDVRRVISKLPDTRQTLFFSATMPDEIAGLADRILKNPEKVAVTPVSSTVDVISQSVCMVGKKEKRELLSHLLADASVVSALVFTRTKHGADRVVRDLIKDGHEADAIHGNKSQNARQYAMKRFKAGKSRVLVATDIAARGIDVDELSHVINFDLPDEPETYVHRIGRTGRAGLSGVAISFCDVEERSKLRFIQKLIGRKIDVMSHPYEDSFTAEEKEKPLPKASEARPRGAVSPRKEIPAARAAIRGDAKPMKSGSGRIHGLDSFSPYESKDFRPRPANRSGSRRPSDNQPPRSAVSRVEGQQQRENREPREGAPRRDDRYNASQAPYRNDRQSGSQSPRRNDGPNATQAPRRNDRPNASQASRQEDGSRTPRAPRRNDGASAPQTPRRSEGQSAPRAPRMNRDGSYQTSTHSANRSTRQPDANAVRSHSARPIGDRPINDRASSQHAAKRPISEVQAEMQKQKKKLFPFFGKKKA